MRKTLIITLVTAGLIIPFSGSQAAITIYLFPRVRCESETLEIRNISKIEASGDLVEYIGGIVIEPLYLSDGYIDSRELHGIINGLTDESVIIVGSAVKIERRDDSKKIQDSPMVSQGSCINLAVQKKGVLVKVPCTAMEDGYEGDIITVQLKGKKTVKARIIEKGLAELSL